MNFKDYYSSTEHIGPQKRHMHPVGRDPSSHPQSPGKFVPDVHKTVHSNQKVSALKKREKGRIVLNDRDIREIEQEFAPLRFDPKTSKNLGNTGIIIKYDTLLQKPIIEK